MPTPIAEEVLRRLVMSKHLLLGQLVPDPDAATVARLVLTSHDAAELAAAAIADHLGVPLGDRDYLMNYVGNIEKHTKDHLLPGKAYMKQLNEARVSLKHHGILPNLLDWYNVADRTRHWINIWCTKYLGITFDEVSLDQLLADAAVKETYLSVKDHFYAHEYRRALETLGRALYQVLDRFPGIVAPSVGRGTQRYRDLRLEHALMLSAFGVRSADFLALQDFLPEVRKNSMTGEVSVKWNPDETGHEANWTQENVRFCLDTFVDIALKIQYAPHVPRAVGFLSVFDHVITPKEEFADLFEYQYEGALLTRRVVGRTLVKRLNKGEQLRCLLWPAEEERPRTPPSLADILGAREPTIETAEVLRVHSIELPNIVYVERKDIDIGRAPKDHEVIRERFPHLFPT